MTQYCGINRCASSFTELGTTFVSGHTFLSDGLKKNCLPKLVNFIFKMLSVNYTEGEAEHFFASTGSCMSQWAE